MIDVRAERATTVSRTCNATRRHNHNYASYAASHARLCSFPSAPTAFRDARSVHILHFVHVVRTEARGTIEIRHSGPVPPYTLQVPGPGLWISGLWLSSAAIPTGGRSDVPSERGGQRWVPLWQHGLGLRERKGAAVRRPSTHSSRFA